MFSKREKQLSGANLLSVLVFTIAGEVASARQDVRGPGTFRAALLDELYNLTPEVLLERAKVEIVDQGSLRDLDT